MMQTFMPFPNYAQSLAYLDNKRLCCQRKEAKQILTIIYNNKWYIKYPRKIWCYICRRKYKNPWFKHPAVQMWIGYESALKLYLDTAISIWIYRGGKNNMSLPYTRYPKFIRNFLISRIKFPPWIGNIKFHDSHKSNLLRKNPKFYDKYNWPVPNNLPYVWPGREKK